MANKMRQPFTPGGKFVASKDFRFAGRRYAKGDEFPWRQLGCSVRRLRTLYEGRFLNNEYLSEEEAYESVEVTAPVDPDLDQDTDDEDDETEDDEDDETDEDETDEDSGLFYDPDRHEIVNPTRGEWYMDEDGEHVLRLKAREAKRLRKKMEIASIDPEAVIED